jgi:mycothiol synthase
VTSTVRTFQPGDEAAIREVVVAGLAVDRIPGANLADSMRYIDRMAGDPGGIVVAVEDGVIVGYCAPRFDEITVHPAHRRRGHGRRLIEASLEIARSRGLSELVLYGSTADPAGAGFIAALGATYHSSLWRFELASSVPVAPTSFPDDVVIRTYAHPADMEAYVALAAESFADHPTPIAFTEELVARSHSLADFDPGGILLVSPVTEPQAFVAWAKARRSTGDDGERRGAIDFIGVVPAWRRRGLGRELLRWCVTWLREGGVGTIELTLVATNERALTLYRAEGFEPTVEWPHYAVSTRPPHEVA